MGGAREGWEGQERHWVREQGWAAGREESRMEWQHHTGREPHRNTEAPPQVPLRHVDRRLGLWRQRGPVLGTEWTTTRRGRHSCPLGAPRRCVAICVLMRFPSPLL